ncbi:uncharacterized protein [Diabrotica undecimpunctata]|uniref:uncharacterized protein n=1 Tax=Diabrotica undecimpunctata TaxID=50387 RepID=UPI003B642005
MITPVALYQCRLCLNKTPHRVNIFGGDFPWMLDVLASIRVHEEDGLPKYSCAKCAKEVQMALMVKKRIIKAHQFLLEALKKKREVFQRTVIPTIVNKVKSSVPNKTKTAKQKEVSKESKPIIKQNQTQSESKLVQNSNEATTNEDANEESVKHDISTEVAEKSSAKQKTKTTRQKAVSKKSRPIIKLHKGSLDQDLENTDFNCETCNLTFPDKRTFTKHHKKHEKRQCHICQRVLRSDNMRKHIRMHESGPSSCSICGATFKNFTGVRTHIFRYHEQTAQQYICEECGKGFRIKYKFLLHKKSAHLGLRNFKCTKCGKAFFTNWHLIAHVRMTHEKLRNHVCEYCGTGFSSRYALKTHERQHTNEKPFVCQICLEGFRQRVSLKSHLKSKHGTEEAKEYFCKICEKGFATNYALNIHERLHKTKKCEICSENFSVGEFLTNHLREVHHVEVEMKQES